MSEPTRRSVKARTTLEDTRRKREEDQVAIRKQKREETLLKRRNLFASAPTTAEMAQQPFPPPQPAPVAAMTAGAPAAVVEMGGDGDDIDEEAAEVARQLQRLPELIAMLNSGQESLQLEAAAQFRKILSFDNPPIDEIIRSGVLTKFVEFLGCVQAPRLQFEAAWSLTNVASGTSAQTQAVVAVGAVPPLVQLLSLPGIGEDVREQCVWALGNVAGDSPQCRDYVLQCEVMPHVVQLLSTAAKPSLLRNGTWAMSNLCRGKPAPKFELVRAALPMLVHLLYSPDNDVLTDAVWGLSYISDGSNERVVALLETGCVRRVVELMGHPHTAVQTPALRTIGNIVAGDDKQTQMALNAGALPAMVALLSSPKRAIRKEACWAISNITAGTKSQIGAVIDAGLIGPLLHLMENGEFEVRKEAAWAVSNACSGGKTDMVRKLAREGCVGPLCGLLSSSDARIVAVALEGLENILRVGEKDSLDGFNRYAQEVEEAEGLGRIEVLQTHQNPDIYDKATKILERYFNAEEIVDGSLLPSMDVGQQQQMAMDAAAAATAAATAPQTATTFSFGLQPSQMNPQQSFF